jgi:hypothetical protein
MLVSRADFSCPRCRGNQISVEVVNWGKDFEKDLGAW